jgi:hypothetical protein
MRLSHSENAELIRELARVASRSKDNSLFSLLLLLEEQGCETAVYSEVRPETPKNSAGLDQQRAVLLTYSRYVE